MIKYDIEFSKVENLIYVEEGELYEIFGDKVQGFHFSYLFDIEEIIPRNPVIDFTELMLVNGISVFEEFSDEEMEIILKEL